MILVLEHTPAKKSYLWKQYAVLSPNTQNGLREKDHDVIH